MGLLFDDDDVKAAIRQGLSPNPALRAKQERRTAREQALAQKTITANQQLGSKLYNVILCDPPWRWQSYSDAGMDRAPENHYPTLSIEDIKTLPIPAARDCALFLWSTVPALFDACEVMAAWGFVYKSSAVWIKSTAGTGFWFRNRHELLLVGTKGSVPAPAMGMQFASVIEAPRGQHSEKPDAVADMIREYFPHVPKLEMFARVRRPGFDAWGNEVNATEEM